MQEEYYADLLHPFWKISACINGKVEIIKGRLAESFTANTFLIFI